MFLRIPGTAVFLATLAFLATAIRGSDSIPPGFKMAFLGDQGLGLGAGLTLKLIKAEGADLVVHLGDFDYASNPAAWDRQTDSILGQDFPQIAVVGNHDLFAWQGTEGYGEAIRKRLVKMGVQFKGEAGVKYSFRYRGIFFVLTAPGLMGTGHGAFIRSELAADSSIWKISAWHMNQAIMNVGGKPDEVGWDVYEESRLGGAIIATAHEHSYSRTHLLSRMSVPEVVSRDSVLRIRRGRTFAFVSGLGGDEVRPQLKYGDWWAKINTSTQGAVPGALFGVFNVDGNPRKARFYFKSVNGEVIDRFEVIREADQPIPREISFPPARPRTLELDPEALGLAPGSQAWIEDVRGRTVARIDDIRGTVTLQLRGAGILFLRTGKKGQTRVRTIVLLP
jgi:hypothetical protein